MELKIGFLFDNDGVLIDSSRLHWASWQLLMQEDKQFSMEREEFERGFGKRNDLIIAETIPQATEEEKERWAQRKEALFREIAAGKIELLPGMENFLKVLKEKKVPRIIASSTPVANLKMYLKTTVLGTYFDAFVSAEEVAHGKPFPDVFQEAAYRLGFLPNECIVLEDAPAGIEAGKRAGCFVVALATTHKKEELSDYDLLYESPKELNFEEIVAAFKKK